MALIGVVLGSKTDSYRGGLLYFISDQVAPSGICRGFCCGAVDKAGGLCGAAPCLVVLVASGGHEALVSGCRVVVHAQTAVYGDYYDVLLAVLGYDVLCLVSSVWAVDTFLSGEVFDENSAFYWCRLDVYQSVVGIDIAARAECDNSNGKGRYVGYGLDFHGVDLGVSVQKL